MSQQHLLTLLSDFGDRGDIFQAAEEVGMLQEDAGGVVIHLSRYVGWLYRASGRSYGD
jgi:hypothetical protein